MGLFGKKDECNICHSNQGSKKILDGFVCDECVKKCGSFLVTLSWKSVPSERVANAIKTNEVNKKYAETFKTTKKINKYLEIDANNKLWRSPAFSKNVYFKFSDVIDFELLEDGESVTKGGLGSAVVGGALFGGAGAIVGGVTGKKKTKKEINEFRVKVITRNPVYPEVYINFLTTGPVKTGSILYNDYKGSAQSILSEFAIMLDSISGREVSNSVSGSGADEILKYKNLLDDGIITKEEFDAKKKQLLGL